MLRWEKIDPAKNCMRYYEITLVPTLFGGFDVRRSYGRIGGHQSMIRYQACAGVEEFAKIVERETRHRYARGYILVVSE